nr:hypothetical protein [Tanacetum cinerariifolium]
VAQQDKKVIEKEVDATQIQVTTAATTPTILIDEATLAQTLVELKHTKPKAKAKGIVFHEQEESTITTTTAVPKSKSQDKGKAKMEQRLAVERAQQEVEANIALIEPRDDVQEKIDAYYQLFERIQAEEQYELNDEEKAKLFIKKLTDLKNKSFDSIQKMFDRAFKRVNTFVDYRTELVKESSKKVLRKK